MEDIEKLYMEIKAKTDCNTQAIDDIKKDVVETNETIKGILEQNKTLYTMNTNIEKICLNMDYQSKEIKEIKEYQSKEIGETKAEIKTVKNEITMLKDAPTKTKAKHFDKVVSALCGALGTGLITYILTQLFPQIFGQG